MAALTAALYSLLAIDEDDAWYRNVVRRQARRRGQRQSRAMFPASSSSRSTGSPTTCCAGRSRDGNAPTPGRLAARRLPPAERWETDWSSQTGACQAGLLHGYNDDMPAFRWWEKDRGAAIVTNHPRDAEELERRHSDGRGLLHADGASRANILSGDAPHSMLTMSTALRRRRPIGRDYSAYFARPYAVARTLRAGARRHRPRAPRGAAARSATTSGRGSPAAASYALVRAWATVVQRDLQVATVVGDVLAGRPGRLHDLPRLRRGRPPLGDRAPRRARRPPRPRPPDRQDRRAPAPTRRVPTGWSSSPTTASRRAKPSATATARRSRTWSARPATPRASIARRGGRRRRARLPQRRADRGRPRRHGRGRARSGPRPAAVSPTASSPSTPMPARRSSEAHGEELPELSVMASGCLGLISFPREPGRVTLERIEALYPRLIPALRDHPGIGFVLVRSERDGAIAIGAGGVNYLDEGRVEGEDPLAPFGPNAADHVRRTDGFPHCPDLVVNSTYWPEFDEVAAFEELVGSHGGMGGTQSHPVRAAPGRARLAGRRRWSAPKRSTGSSAPGWRASARTAYAENEVASPGASTRDLDLRRQLGAASAANSRGGASSVAGGASRARPIGYSVPQWIGIAIRGCRAAPPRGRPARGRGGPARASVPSPRPAAARGRARRADRRHPLEEVGVAGEVDAPLAPASTKPIGSRGSQRSAGRRPCSASTAVTSTPPTVCRFARRELGDRGEAAPR